MPTLDELTERKALLELQRDIAALEAQAQTASLAGRSVDFPFGRNLAEGWGDSVDPLTYLHDGQGMSNFGFEDTALPISQASDRKRGDNIPIWRSEPEHARIRGVSRVIATVDEVGGAALENLVNYCIGKGFSYTATTRPGTPVTAETKRYAAIAQGLVDRFIERNSWWGDGEREAFVRSRRDGDHYLVLVPDTGPVPCLRFIDPSFVQEPDQPRALEDYLRIGGEDTLDWKYGHASPWNDSSQTEWVFVNYYGDSLEWEAIPESRLVHLKLNTDREVKRGLSDFYPVYRNLQNADRLLQNTVQGAAVQAAIAYIREHAPGVTGDQVSDWVSGRSDTRTTGTMPTGNVRSRNVRNIKTGTVVDVKQGVKYHAGPMGTQRGQQYIAIIQAALRLVGIRWQMPEYMISGDASNGNFASTLVAEAPFTKSAEAKQTYYCRKYTELLWKMLAVAFRMGSFPVPPHRAQLLLSISCIGPEIAVRDQMDDHKIRKEEYEAGIRSAETWATEAGLDFPEERAKGAGQQPTATATGQSGRDFPPP